MSLHRTTLDLIYALRATSPRRQCKACSEPARHGLTMCYRCAAYHKQASTGLAREVPDPGAVSALPVCGRGREDSVPEVSGPGGSGGAAGGIERRRAVS